MPRSPKQSMKWRMKILSTRLIIVVYFQYQLDNFLGVNLRSIWCNLGFWCCLYSREKASNNRDFNSALSKKIDDWEPTLTWHGYDVRGLAEQFNAKPAEICLLFRRQFDPFRVRQLQKQMLMAPLPIWPDWFLCPPLDICQLQLIPVEVGDCRLSCN